MRKYNYSVRERPAFWQSVAASTSGLVVESNEASVSAFPWVWGWVSSSTWITVPGSCWNARDDPCPNASRFGWLLRSSEKSAVRCGEYDPPQPKMRQTRDTMMARLQTRSDDETYTYIDGRDIIGKRENRYASKTVRRTSMRAVNTTINPPTRRM